MLHNDYQEAGGERVSVAHEVAALRESGATVHLLQTSNAEHSSSVQLARRMLSRNQSREMVRTAIDGFQPDVIHAQNLFPLIGAGAVEAAAERGVPWVRTLRNYRLRCLSANLQLNGESCTRCSSAATALPGVLNGCYKDSRVYSAGALAYAMMESRATAANPPRAYVLLSRHMKTLLGKVLSPVRTRISANVVPPWPGSKPARADLAVDVLFVGRAVDEKGWPLVCELAAARPELRFTALIAGRDTGTVRSLPANLHLLRDLSNADVLTWMSRSAVVVVPSQWDEPFGRVAIESLATGTPCLVSDRGGLPEIVESLDGLTVGIPEVEAWSQALTRVLGGTAAEYQDLSERCRGLWAADFAPPATAARLHRVYAEALGRSVPELEPTDARG